MMACRLYPVALLEKRVPFLHYSTVRKPSLPHRGISRKMTASAKRHLLDTFTLPFPIGSERIR